MTKGLTGRRTSWLACLLLAAIVLALAGCSDANSDDAANNSDAESDAGMSMATAGEAASMDDAAAVDQYGEEESVEMARNESGDHAVLTQPQTTSIRAAEADDGGLNRKLIYKAHVAVEVESYADAQTRVRDMAQLSGGYILNFEENHTDYERSGSFTLKIPSTGFSSFLDGLEKMHPLSIQRSVEGHDVTSEYVDLEARLKAKRVVETRLLAFMEEAKEAKDLLAFSKELSPVQEEIERILGRMRYLDQNVAFSTVDIRLYERLHADTQVASNDGSFADRLYRAMRDSVHAVQTALEGVVIAIAVLLPVLAVLAIVGLPFLYVYARRRSAKRLPVSEGAQQEQAHPDLHPASQGLADTADDRSAQNNENRDSES